MIKMGPNHVLNECQYGYNIPIVNVKQGRRKRSQNVQLNDCFNEVQIYQITLPFTTTNGNATQTKKRKKRQTQQKMKCKTPCCDSEMDDMKGVEEECLKKEERRKSIRKKLEQGQEYLFTKLEERDIHERAEIYSMSVAPDEDYYIPPDELKHDSIMLTKHHKNDTGRKGKRRNYLSDSVFLSYHNTHDPYDNSHQLPLGSKLMRPPDKLVELVAQAIDGSPDGLLQVPQIYTVVQNRYPYFRYMDRAALGSWRSSIRHALYQKWFRKMRFGTHAINTKGCYWANNHTYVPISRKEETMSRKMLKRSMTSNMQPFETQKQGQDVDDFDLDPDTHDKVVALLTEEEEKETESQNELDNMEDVVCLAKEYGISLEEYGPLLGMNQDESSSPPAVQSLTVPSPTTQDPDPILSEYMSDSSEWQAGPRDHMLNSISKTRPIHSPAILPVSVFSMTQNSIEKQPFLFNTSSSPGFLGVTQAMPDHVLSPSVNCASPAILQMGQRFDNSSSLLSDPQMGIGPSSQSSEGCQFVKEPDSDREPSLLFDIEQLAEMYNTDIYTSDNYLDEWIEQ